jgi:hypothetical protein
MAIFAGGCRTHAGLSSPDYQLKIRSCRDPHFGTRRHLRSGKNLAYLGKHSSALSLTRKVANEIRRLAHGHLARSGTQGSRLGAIGSSLPASDAGVAIGPDEVRIPV